jgi:phospholipid/cholesterol/gamma-HCH transport system substrate-binding protein
VKLSKELKVGLFMVSGITLLYLGFNYLKGVDFFSTNDKYYAIYANVDGLNISNPILINGFTVGRVSRIQLLQNETDNVLVEFDISGEIVLGDSSIATLSSDFLGNKSISLSTGNIKKPLHAGDTLIAMLDKGIADFLESAQPVATSLDVTIKKLNLILENLVNNEEKINLMFDGFSKTPIILNSSLLEMKNKIGTVADSYNEFGLEMTSTIKSLQPTLKNLTQFTDSLKRVELNKTLGEVNKAVASLNKAIEHFSNNDGTLGKLINSDSLYVNLNSAVENLDRLLIHIDTNPKHFLAPLGKRASKIERQRRRDANKKGN